MAEWLKAAVLKTVERKFRGFESYSLRHSFAGGANGRARPGAKWADVFVACPAVVGHTTECDLVASSGTLVGGFDFYIIKNMERWPSWLKAHAC